MKIIVGVDGSPSSMRAVEWCATHAPEMKAEVIAVFSIEMPVYLAGGFGSVPLPPPVAPDRDKVRKVVEGEWCAALAKASVPFRVVLADGAPAPVVIALAAQENADLVVTGCRGHGGFTELLLGSTSHHLAHHLNRPLVIIP
jgi:nucleotide-binding universal stress UspA family protein